jgi:hypothetical protein
LSEVISQVSRKTGLKLLGVIASEYSRLYYLNKPEFIIRGVNGLTLSNEVKLQALS